MRRALNTDTHALKQRRLSLNSSLICSSFLLVIVSDVHLSLRAKRLRNVEFHTTEDVFKQTTPPKKKNKKKTSEQTNKQKQKNKTKKSYHYHYPSRQLAHGTSTKLFYPCLPLAIPGRCPSCGSCSSFPLPEFFARLSSVDHASAFLLGPVDCKRGDGIGILSQYVPNPAPSLSGDDGLYILSPSSCGRPPLDV